MRDIATIDARLDAVDEILRSETVYLTVQQLLSKMPKARWPSSFPAS